MVKNAARAGSLSGVAFVVLVLAANVVSGSFPDTSASPMTVIDFYRAHRTDEQLGAVLTAVAVVAGLYFFGSLRSYLGRDADGNHFASIGFAGAILFAVGGCINAGLQWSLADVPSRLTPAAAQALNVLYTDNLATGLFIAGLATLMLFYGIAMVRTRLMPHWLGWLSIALGVVALAGPLAFLVFVATAPWTIIVSILLYRRAGGDAAYAA
jgi:hypothetical protein